MMEFSVDEIKKLYIPPPDSHKGQNGKLMVIGGSVLFHAASLWSLKIASRIVDMVYYSSIPENNEIVEKNKEEFRDGIVVPRGKLDDYIQEADCVLIGPGLPRKEGQEEGDDNTKELTGNLLKKYPDKKWVIDGGSLQVIEPSLIPQNAILTPHYQEFGKLFSRVIPDSDPESPKEELGKMAREHNCIILLKGSTDIVCSPTECVQISGGNVGMTKGGTGDVLAGLIAALNCKNDPFLSAKVGSFINKKAGESLAQKVGPYFNASDLVDEIPKVLNTYVARTT